MRHSVRVSFAGLLTCVALSVPQVARGSATYPQAVADATGSPCVPLCTICHINLIGGTDSVKRPFGKKLMSLGLQGGSQVGLLKSTLKKLGDSDVDGDRITDLDEFIIGSDPNDAAGDAQICNGPRYGCGAHIARTEQTQGNEPLYAALAFSALGVGAVLRRRRR